MPTKIAPPSRPESRSPSRAPFASSIANDRPIASSAASRTAAQNRPGAACGNERAVGVEREREHHHDDPAERQDLLQRDTRAPLDPQVLARDEQRLAEEAHARASSLGLTPAPAVVAAPAPGARQRLVHLTGGDADLAGREAAGEVELVRREQHRAALGRRGAHDLVEHVAALLVETGVRLVEQEQARIARERDRERQAGGAGPARAGRG